MFRIEHANRKPLIPLLLVLMIFLAPALAGCERDRGWAALTGRSEHWETMVIVRMQGDRVSNQTIMRYLGPDELSGSVEVITKRPHGEFKIWGTPDSKRIGTGTAGSSNSYRNWENARQVLQSVEVEVTWETPKGKRTETISVSE